MKVDVLNETIVITVRRIHVACRNPPYAEAKAKLKTTSIAQESPGICATEVMVIRNATEYSAQSQCTRVALSGIYCCLETDNETTKAMR